MCVCHILLNTVLLLLCYPLFTASTARAVGNSIDLQIHHLAFVNGITNLRISYCPCCWCCEQRVTQ